MESFLTFCNELSALRLHYDLAVHRDDAVMVKFAVPGYRYEVEFFRGGTIEIERFTSEGVTPGTEAELRGVLDGLS